MDDCCQLNGHIFIKGEHSENIYQMIPKEKALRQYGEIVYDVLSSLIECTFGELQKISSTFTSSFFSKNTFNLIIVLYC